MNLLVTSIATTIGATLLLVIILFFFYHFLFQLWNLKAQKRLQNQKISADAIRSIHQTMYKMTTSIDKPEPFGIMNVLLEDAKTIREHLKQKEADAKALKAWLNENPNAPEEHVKLAKRQLMDALQAINDLVVKLKPRQQIIIR